jgi:hypothetical protein
MKYTSQRNRLHAIEAQLGRPGQVIRIVGGLPPAEVVPEPASEPTDPAPVDRASNPPRNRD